MIETYADFMVFGVKDDGEQNKLDVTEEEFRQSKGSDILFSTQVALIIKESLRRIYIWKGMSSSVRKKFIASRVASRLQRNLMDMSNFHRCKIVSVDQGDEPTEFLEAFGFQTTLSNDVIPSYPADQHQIEEQNMVHSLKLKYEEDREDQAEKNMKTTASYRILKARKESRKILNEILSFKSPNDFTRKHVLIGNTTLYGLILKKAEMFGESHESLEWDVISKFPREVFDLEGHKLRIHINRELRMIEAIEVLEKNQDSIKSDHTIDSVNFNSWTVKQLKQLCSENNIKVPSSYRKADIIRLVMEKRVPLKD
jgi:hypothetical protein